MDSLPCRVADLGASGLNIHTSFLKAEPCRKVSQYQCDIILWKRPGCLVISCCLLLVSYRDHIKYRIRIFFSHPDYTSLPPLSLLLANQFSIARYDTRWTLSSFGEAWPFWDGSVIILMIGKTLEWLVLGAALEACLYPARFECVCVCVHTLWGRASVRGKGGYWHVVVRRRMPVKSYLSSP